MSKRTNNAAPERKTNRCAIYTRKSTEEGLQQDFNSLDAQREAGEAYIASQKTEGWTCLSDRYDDGGFTGGNIERPALKRLLKDIDAGLIDCVVVYKVDRLSRSLMDFAKIMETFDRHKVSFVSVTQHFNTTHSMGRLTLNILLSFAQFEREIISERTRDKIAAARRKGKWSGGRPVLGYDLLSSPQGPRLVVNETEAARVRQIFDLYLKHERLIPTVETLNQRGWTTKQWESRKNTSQGGSAFDKNNLFKMLTNVVYVGKVRYHDEIHPGEQPAIVDEAIWQRVQAILKRNGRSGGAPVKNRHGALLKGLIRCVPCNCAMGHSFSAQNNRRYRYYVCMHAQKRGWASCPSKSVPAGEIEQFVVDQIKRIADDPAVLTATVRKAGEQTRRALADLVAEDAALRRDVAKQNARLAKLATAKANAATASALANANDQLREAERRLTAIRELMIELRREVVDEHEVRAALAAFDPLWSTLSPREKERIVHLLVEHVDYDGEAGTVSVTLRPNGLKSLVQQHEEVAA